MFTVFLDQIAMAQIVQKKKDVIIVRLGFD